MYNIVIYMSYVFIIKFLCALISSAFATPHVHLL